MTDSNFYIESPRLFISYFQPANDAHLDFMIELSNSPAVSRAHEGVAVPLTDREEARKRLEDGRVEQATTGFGRYIVSLKAVDIDEDQNPTMSFLERSKTLTYVGLVALKMRNHQAAARIPDLGFSQLDQFCGRGYATEAVNALLGYFESEKGVTEVLGYCNPHNENSKKMFRRLGFEDRGVRSVKGLGMGSVKDVGINALVWTKKEMKKDLSEYGL